MQYDTSTMGPVPQRNLSVSELAEISNNSSNKDFGLVSVLVPAIVSAISIAASAGTAAANRKYQKQQQEQQQNYNDPTAQMERLKEAGLNPNLALGSVSSGDFGQTPLPLPDMGQVIGSSANTAFQGINAAISLKQQQQNIEMMNERIRQLRISNNFAELSSPDRLRLIAANLLSANRTNRIGDLEEAFAKWLNGENPNISAWWSANGTDFSMDNLSPRQYQTVTDMMYGSVRSEKVYQDYLNSIKNGDILGAQLYGMQIGNSRAEIARDYEQSTHMAWGSNMRPLDMILSFALRGLLEKYGPKLMKWLESLP